MKKFAATAVAMAALAGGGLGWAAAASAIPMAGEPADQVLQTLESDGYVVRVNGPVSVQLSSCTVLSVNGLRGAETNGALTNPGSLNVASIDVNCPSMS